jgi:hypothetical protein
MLVPFGNFEGEELFFPEINVKILLRPGLVVAFKSAELLHQVLSYTSDRYSVVLFTPQNCFHPRK